MGQIFKNRFEKILEKSVSFKEEIDGKIEKKELDIAKYPKEKNQIQGDKRDKDWERSEKSEKCESSVEKAYIRFLQSASKELD